MDSNLPCRTKRRQAGFTLGEVMIAMAIAFICLGALLAFSLFSGRGLLAMSNHMELEAQARKCLDQMTLDLRRCLAVTGYTTNSVTLRDHDNAALSYAYNSTNRTLVRTKASVTTTLLTECDALTFGLYGPSLQNGTYSLNPVSSTNGCKAIQVAWTCSRKFVDSKLNAANNTSAIIVMRMAQP